MGTRRAEPRRERFLQKGGLCFSWGHAVSWQSPGAAGGKEMHPPRPPVRVRCCTERGHGGAAQPQPTPPEQSGSEMLLITIFLPPAPTRRSGSPAAASLGTRKEQHPGAQPHLPPGYQRAAFSANRGDGGSEEPRCAQALRSPAASQLPVPARTRCHRQSPCSCYNREKKLCRSEQLNGSQTCSSAAFLRSVFMYLA